MAIAQFKDLCLDAGDPARLGAFWAAALGRAWEAKDDGDGLVTGPTPQHTMWVNRVPEAKTGKHRVHLDIYAQDLAGLEALGATVVQPRDGTRTWTVMADPEATSSARSPGSSGRLALGRRRRTWPAPPLSCLVWRSAHVDRRVVEDERGLQLVVLAAGELQRDLLPGEAAQREGVLGVPGVVVEVGVGVQRGQHRAGA